ncbi:hypothetical protein OTU49_010441, partial [Cherax quadricarinatus]
ETYYLDPDDEEAWSHVEASLLDGLEATKLEDCCREALQCCQTTLEQPPGGVETCPGTWDGWRCFSNTPPDTTVTFTCPTYAYKSLPECTLSGSKECLGNGTWARNVRNLEVTNYSSCSLRNYHISTYCWEAVMHSLSLLALFPAIFVILYYRQLRVQRFYLHVNFFSALFGKALFNLVEILALRIPEYTGSNNTLDNNTVGCRLLVFVTKVTSLAVWTWMLAESFYLHRLIVAAFRGGGKTYIYVIIGWVPACVLSVCWAGGRALLEDTQCWLGDDYSHSVDLYLITELPKIIILIANTLMLLNMARVLHTKLQGVNTTTAAATKRAVKATTFLLPMFGFQFFSTLVIPPASCSCHIMQAYVFVATAVDGLQGLYVALVYCFLNKEVRLQVRRTVYQVRGRYGTDRSYSVTYDPRTDVSLLSGSVANEYSAVDYGANESGANESSALELAAVRS